MADNKKKKFDLGIPQTKGTFQTRGMVIGTDKDNFYTEKLTKTNKPWRETRFGVQFDKDNTLYVRLNGMEKQSVYYSKKPEEKGGKPTILEVGWKERFSFKENPQNKDFNLIGVNVGVTKIKDAKGNDVNDKKRLTEYDACKEIGDNLNDNQFVFVKGAIDYSTYNDRHTTNFVPSQVSLCKDVDFEAEDFKPIANFTQYIVFTGIKRNEDNTKATISAKIVNYNSIEDAEFYTTNMSLAKTFYKQLKPYTGIKVWGDISIEKNFVTVTTTDCWGEENDMDKINSPTVRELYITGADPETIDTTTYTEEAIDKAIAIIKASKTAENDFGNSNDSNDTWGSVGSTDDDEEMDAGW
jgi:hypothetical protein